MKFFEKIKIFSWFIWLIVAVFLPLMLRWTFSNFANPQMDELIYTLTSSSDGVNMTLFKQLGWTVFMPTLVFSLCLIYFYHLLKSNDRKIKLMRLLFAFATFSIVGSVIYFSNRVDFVGYVNSQTTDSEFIEEHYVVPDEVELTFPDDKRNLIYIFVESLETSFADEEHGGGKKENVIPELTEIALKNETFSKDSEEINGAVTLFGGTYTMAGLVSQTSGLPLKISAEKLSKTDAFLPGVVSIGDILAAEGYQNYFLLGTNAAFADRDRYFKEHGEYSILDYNYALENKIIKESYSRDFWGYDDATLYKQAKSQLKELAKNDEPFNLTMLTVDTHAEDGYVSDELDKPFKEQYANAFSQASSMLGDFLTWLEKQDFYDNTTVVIAGDHLTMDSDFADDLAENYQRKVYTTILNSPTQKKRQDNILYSTLDLFPTTLAALGVDIAGDRLALGTNLFSSEKTLLEQFDETLLNKELKRKSTFYNQFVGQVTDSQLNMTHDKEEYTLDISIEKEKVATLYDGEVTEAYIKVTSGERETVIPVENKKTKYYTVVPIEEIYERAGNYKVELFVTMPDGLSVWLAEGNIELEDSDTPLTYSLADSELTITYRIHQDLAKNVELLAGIWTKEKNQDDLAWYTANLDKGQATWTIDLSKHPTKDGEFQIHIFENDGKTSERVIASFFNTKTIKEHLIEKRTKKQRTVFQVLSISFGTMLGLLSLRYYQQKHNRH